MAIAIGSQALAADILGLRAVGTYAGDGNANRAVPHGLILTPKTVIIYDATYNNICLIIQGNAAIVYMTDDGGLVGAYAVTAVDITNFYVGNAGSYPRSANENLRTYYWVALA